MKRHLLLFALLLLSVRAMLGQHLPEAPSLTVDTTSLSFSYNEGYGPSESQQVTITGSNLTENVNVMVTEGTAAFEVSINQNEFFAEQLTFSINESGQLDTTVYVRMKDGLTLGNYNGTLTISSGSESEIFVSLSGQVTEQPTYNITYSPDSNNPSNGCYISGVVTAHQGDEVTVTVTTTTGYELNTLTYNGTNVPFVDGEYKFSMPASDVTVTATFSQSTYNITYSPDSNNPSNGCYISGVVTAHQGDEVTVTVMTASGYELNTLTYNGTNVPFVDGEYKFSMPASDVTVTATFSQSTYNITYSPDSNNPSNGCYISGVVIAHQGDEVTVTVTTATGYELNTLTYNGTNVPFVDGEYKFSMPASDVTVTANFVRQYTITVTANNHGTAYVGDTPGTTQGTYNQGASCTVHAVANSGYVFTNWTENGNVVSSSADYTFTVNSNRILQANFEVQPSDTYNIDVSANPTNGGAPYIGNSPGTTHATYTNGQPCTVHANPADGYTFLRWTENGIQVSTNPNYTFTVTGNRTLVAQFQQQNYTISVLAVPSNGGTVTGGGAYHYGDNCTVTATANSGFTFTKWTENGAEVTTEATYSFTVTSNHTLMANFTEQVNTYTINVSADPTNGGAVSGNGTYNQGASCTVQAVANSGYVFTNWTEGNTVVSTQANYTFIVNGNHNLVAHFVRQYTVNVSAIPSAGGSVSGGGTYNQGTSCTVHAVANGGFVFTNWTENGTVVSTQFNYTFTVNSNHTLVAHFTPQYTISVFADPTNGGTVTGGGDYTQGQSCTVYANANSGYVFTNWTENDNVVSTDANYSFTVTANRNLVANFVRRFTIKVSANPEEGGTVSGGGTFNQGEQCTVTAMANEDYAFIKWTENDNEVSDNPNYTFTVTSDRILVAQFEELEENQYYINVAANPSSGGTVTGAGIYYQDSIATVNAMVNAGFNFKNWTEGSNVVSENEEYTFTVDRNRTLIANFESQQYHIQVSANPEEGGTVTGGGDFNYGQDCIVHAWPNPGFTFTNWTENGQEVSDLPEYHFNVTDHRNLVANFQSQQYHIQVSANPTNGGEVTGGGYFNHGITAKLMANANVSQGYAFANWTENGAVVYTEAEYEFTVTCDRTLVANFAVAQYQINTETSTGGSISLSQYQAQPGTLIRITVEEDDGYVLDTIIVNNQNNSEQTVPVTDNTFRMPNYDVTVKAVFKPEAMEIDTPAPICSGESLDLGELVLPWFPPGYWQLSPTEDFDNGNTITYTDQALDASYDGWSLRYHAQESGLEWYSNVVHITVNSLAEMTLEGEESASLDQEVEYILVIEGQDNYAEYSFNWSVSDEQAEVTILDNSCKVTWKTTGTQQVSVTVTDETTGCTNLLVMDVNVTACIDNLQEIVAKDHKDGTETYVLILVYPNPNNEDYTYQWLYSSNDEIYHELTEGTAKKQYYYKGGSIKDGYYKVRISKDGCSEETLPYHVNDGGRLHIYPNPSHRGTGVVVVNDGDSPAQLTIYSTDGRVLHTQTMTSDQATIGINLPQGVYVAYLTTSDGYTKIGKLIIQ